MSSDISSNVTSDESSDESNRSCQRVGKGEKKVVCRKRSAKSVVAGYK